jgi:hypothetical protein
MEANQNSKKENDTLGYIGLLLALASIIFGVVNVINP